MDVKKTKGKPMTSELKCPFCQTELDMDMMGEISCPNDSCKESVFLVGTEDMWQALIQAKQDLERAEVMIADLNTILDITRAKYAQSRKSAEIATDALNAIIATPLNSRAIHDTADKALEQIEHKDK